MKHFTFIKQGLPLKDLTKKLKKLSRKQKIICAAVILVIAALAAFLLIKNAGSKKKNSTSSEVHTSTVKRGDVSNELTSSGTLSPKDTYTITSLVSGEIVSTDCEEGDQVEKDQTLFVIDQSDISNDMNSADRNLSTAQTAYDEAVKDHDTEIGRLGNGTYCSSQSGYVKDIKLKAGDTVGGNQSTAIATLYNDTRMKVRIGFLNTDADAIGVGQAVTVTLSDTGESISGTVSSKSDLIETVDGGILVKYLEITVTNPGGLTTSDHATASVGDITSVTDGTFEAAESSDLKVELNTSVKVAKVLMTEGEYVAAGSPLFTITSDTLEDAVNAADDSLTKAENTLIDAKNKVSSMSDTQDKYTITAPISGQVIKKYMKTGEKITSGSNSNNELALIYDLSELTFEMSIDELDISNVKVGQEVRVTADAFEDKTYTGHVTNVGLNGTVSNGVTTYPVVVTLDDMDGLLPGMNVDGVIILEKSEDTLYIPSNALQRGNIVYVKDDSLTDEQKSGTGETGNDGSEGGRPEGGQSADGKSPDNSSGSSKSGETHGMTAPEGFTAVRVETGIVSNDYVEITSGLSEGQEVYVKDDESSDSGFFNMGGPGDMGGGMGGMGGGPGNSQGGSSGGHGGSGSGGGRPGGF